VRLWRRACRRGDGRLREHVALSTGSHPGILVLAAAERNGIPLRARIARRLAITEALQNDIAGALVIVEPARIRFLLRGSRDARFQEPAKDEACSVLSRSRFSSSGPSVEALSDVVLQVLTCRTRARRRLVCVEIGTHLTFLPTVRGGASQIPGKIVVCDCEFRRRLAPNGRPQITGG